MKPIIILLLCRAAICAQSVSFGPILNVAPALGYRDNVAGFVELNGDRAWGRFTARPLAKTTEHGGEYLSGYAQADLWHGLGAAASIAEEIAPAWRKTTLWAGPAYEYRARAARIWVAYDPYDFVTPNRARAVGWGFERSWTHAIAFADVGMKWFHNPFTATPARELFGASVTVGVGYNFTVRREQP